MTEFTETPQRGDPHPVVGALEGGHRVEWTVEDQWTCSCGHRHTSGAPKCPHVVQVARTLTPRLSNALINARRAAGHIPPGLDSGRIK